MIRIQNTAPRIITLGAPGEGLRVKLLPGVNELETQEQIDAWEAAKLREHIQRHLEAGTFVELNGNPLSELPTKDVQKLVQDCVSREQLVKWKAGETREVIVAAIEKQLKKITPPAEKAK